ncbi:hypothetical protein CgunFtcFv8_014815 [Champsocephalus gunnari]|uniref:Uncharacterized protein n=1 Tax=Champsocephalus gunnari TaxID=52237 RepID=A0AAN8E8Y6_CHAGU|nr:hypothetical protein CgunFtcFv8_014815 [Champsocephalus gunnari]
MYSSRQQQPPPDQPSTHSGGGGIAVMGRDMLSRPWGPFHICSLPPPVCRSRLVSRSDHQRSPIIPQSPSLPSSSGWAAGYTSAS